METSTEIVAKKLWHRGDRIAARDVFDVAMVAEKLNRLDEVEFHPAWHELLGIARAAINARLRAIPEPAPVITATLPSSSPIMCLL